MRIELGKRIELGMRIELELGMRRCIGELE